MLLLLSVNISLVKCRVQKDTQVFFLDSTYSKTCVTFSMPQWQVTLVSYTHLLFCIRMYEITYRPSAHFQWPFFLFFWGTKCALWVWRGMKTSYYSDIAAVRNRRGGWSEKNSLKIYLLSFLLSALQNGVLWAFRCWGVVECPFAPNKWMFHNSCLSCMFRWWE